MFRLLSSQFTSGVLHPAYTFWSTLPQLPLQVGFALNCAQYAPELRANFLVHYWLAWLAGYAGGLVSSLLMMTPAVAPISLFASNKAVLVWTACWWLANYSPMAQRLRHLLASKPFQACTRACVAYMRASIIIQRVRAATQLYPGVVAAPIILGTIAATAGKHTHDMLAYHYQLMRGPVEFTTPTYSFRSAFLGTCLFYLASQHPATAFLTWEQAAGALLSLFVGHSLLASLTGWPLDWTEPLLGSLLKLGNIPWPGPLPATSDTKPSSLPGGPSVVEKLGAKSGPTSLSLHATPAPGPGPLPSQAVSRGAAATQGMCATGAGAMTAGVAGAKGQVQSGAAAGVSAIPLPELSGPARQSDGSEGGGSSGGVDSDVVMMSGRAQHCLQPGPEAPAAGGGPGATGKARRRAKAGAGAAEAGWQVVASKPSKRPATSR
ncbi:hypothetical protein V8C86DRAFT_2802170 [Haematococcus lacustris]